MIKRNSQPRRRPAGAKSAKGASRRRLLGIGKDGFLGSLFVRPAVAALAPQSLPPATTLVVIFLRGGMDGLSLVAPASHPRYSAARGSLAIPASTPLDGFFHLGVGGKYLESLYNLNRLAFVHRVGAHGNSLSHFDANVHLESGRNGQVNPLPVFPETGWAARWINATNPPNVSLRGINHGSVQPWSLRGASKTIPVRNPQAYNLPDSTVAVGTPVDTKSIRGVQMRSEFGRPSAPAPVGAAGVATIDTIGIFGQVGNWNAANYPGGYFGDQMRRTEALVRAQASASPPTGMALNAVMLDFGGWDHHANLYPNDFDPHGNGFRSMMDVLSRGLVAFDDNLRASGLGDRYVVVVMSEFGRRVAANGTSGGLDHGNANCWMVLGSGVNGGQVHAAGWNALTNWDNAVLDANGNLAIAYDYRNLLTEILVRRFNYTGQVSQIFDGLTYVPTGVMA